MTDNHDMAQPSSSHGNLRQKLTKFLQRLCGDGLLAYVVYAIMFILLFSSASNAMHFGRLVMLYKYDPDSDNDTSASELETNIIGFLTFSILCLAHLWFPKSGRLLNKVTAVLKIIAVFGLIVVGGSSKRSNIEDKRCNGTGGKDSTSRAEDGLAWVGALLSIFFSFQGWENATFVSCCFPILGSR